MENPKVMAKTRTLRIGIRNRLGYTLIELIVVIAIVCLTLFFSTPAIRDALIKDDLDSTIHYLEAATRDLRVEAVREQVDQELHISLDDLMIWVSTADMTPGGKDECRREGFQLPEGVKIIDIQPITGEKQSTGETTIGFHRQNYADPVAIHLAKDDRQITLMIEPFLKAIQVHEKYVDIRDITRSKASPATKESGAAGI